MANYTLKSKPLFMGAGLTRTIWGIFHDDHRCEWFTSEAEAINKLAALNRDGEVLRDD